MPQKPSDGAGFHRSSRVPSARVSSAALGEGPRPTLADGRQVCSLGGESQQGKALTEMSGGINVDHQYQSASSRKACTSAANWLWCWKRKPWAESG